MDIINLAGLTIIWMAGICVIPFILAIVSLFIWDAEVAIVVFWASAFLYLISSGIIMAIV
jgi:hypothetical protein